MQPEYVAILDPLNIRLAEAPVQEPASRLGRGERCSRARPGAVVVFEGRVLFLPDWKRQSARRNEGRA